MAEETNERLPDSPSVFVSYSSHDKSEAESLVLRLQKAGINVWWDESFLPGDNLRAVVDSRLRASDYILFLLSPSSMQSQFFIKQVHESNLLREYNDRSITVIPILLHDVELPSSLLEFQYLDFRTNPQLAMDKLVSRLRTNLTIDFAALSGAAFEELIADLLVEIGFSIERNILEQGREFDFRAQFQSRDPFGALQTEEWIIEVKHRNSGRLSVSEIAAFARYAPTILRSKTKLALVTSGQLTSAGREMLRSTSLRIIENVELKRILLTRPQLVERHFGPRLK